MSYPRIEFIGARTCVGIKTTTCTADNQSDSFKLWSKFVPALKQLNVSQPNLYSIQQFDPTLTFQDFTPQTLFEKWAAIEAREQLTYPEDWEQKLLPEGYYLVGLHRGLPMHFQTTFQYLVMKWLPNTDFSIDQTRPHFEIMDHRYQNNSEDSEEEVWIPIKRK